MGQNTSTCIQCVGGQKICSYCQKKLIKHGYSKSGKQRYKCKSCIRTQVDTYTYQACKLLTNNKIINLTKEGCGVRSIARLLKIGTNTVLRRIRYIAKQIKKPNLCFCKEYELDELCTYVKSKPRKRWIVYAIRKDTKEVVDFSIGSRTNRTLRKVTDTLILSDAAKVFTDKLPNYKYLLPSSMPSTNYRGTNHIERKNLTLRTHLKRLNRRTICFSRSIMMLHACLMIYFFG
ncbi:MAG: IS1 family transposase [Flavobacterium sp.]|nr:MAG: IS1 family transposase [Flavobacterium sp.]